MVSAVFSKKCSFAIIAILILLLPICIIENIQANPIIPGISLGIGGILYPNSSYTLYMEDADVRFSINAKKYKKRIFVDFEGKYNISNLNETLETTIAAPFASYFEALNETIEVFANDEEIDTAIIYLNGSALSVWSKYIHDYYTGRYFVLANVTLQGYSSTTLMYKWSSVIEPQEHDYIVGIEYDVGTGRSWNNTLSEKVTMTVLGKKPDGYRERYAVDFIDDELVVYKEAKVLHFLGFHNYVWEWKDDKILDDNVYISYYYIPPHYPRDISFYFPQMIAGIASMGVLVIGTFKIVERARRKEGL